LDDAALEKAALEYTPHIERFAECQRTDTWPCFSEMAETITLPSWSW